MIVVYHLKHESNKLKYTHIHVLGKQTNDTRVKLI